MKAVILSIVILALTALAASQGPCKDNALSFFVTANGHIRAKYADKNLSPNDEGVLMTSCGLTCSCDDDIMKCCSEHDCIDLDENCPGEDSHPINFPLWEELILDVGSDDEPVLIHDDFHIPIPDVRQDLKPLHDEPEPVHDQPKPKLDKDKEEHIHIPDTHEEPQLLHDKQPKLDKEEHIPDIKPEPQPHQDKQPKLDLQEQFPVDDIQPEPQLAVQEHLNIPDIQQPLSPFHAEPHDPPSLFEQPDLVIHDDPFILDSDIQPAGSLFGDSDSGADSAVFEHNDLKEQIDDLQKLDFNDGSDLENSLALSESGGGVLGGQGFDFGGNDINFGDNDFGAALQGIDLGDANKVALSADKLPNAIQKPDEFPSQLINKPFKLEANTQNKK